MAGPLQHHAWQPCTGSQSVRDFLDSRQFPISFRSLVPQWKSQRSPPLRTLRAPWGLNMHSDSLATLESITFAQEEHIANTIAAAQIDEDQSNCMPMPFAAFQSHLDTYCSVYAELTAAPKQQAFVYEQLQRALLQSFDLERGQCMKHGAHHCLGHVLWGEVYSWPIEKIKQRLTGAPLPFDTQAKLFTSLRASWSPASLSARPVLPLHLSTIPRSASLACVSSTARPSAPSSPWTARYEPLQIDVSSILRSASLTPATLSPSEPSDADLFEMVDDYFSMQHRHSVNTVMSSCWSASSYGSIDAVDKDDDDVYEDAQSQESECYHSDHKDVQSKRIELSSELSQVSLLPNLLCHDVPAQQDETIYAIGLAL